MSVYAEGVNETPPTPALKLAHPMVVVPDGKPSSPTVNGSVADDGQMMFWFGSAPICGA